MSKIEAALAKVRGRVVPLESANGTNKPGTNMVPAQGRALANRQAQQAVAATALRRMSESWLLEPRDLAERRIIHFGTTDTHVTSAFRNLRTKILQAAQGNCSIVVTSCAKGRDSSLIATNLAVSFSLDDIKTATLINCNLAANAIDELTQSENRIGISDYLRNESIRLEQVIHPVGLARLRVIPAGKSHDGMAEYFTLPRMRELLGELHARYADRYIVLNAPPLFDSADARVLVGLADYVVLVVPYGSVTEAQIVSAAKMIGERKLLGAVFSDMPWFPSNYRGLLGWVARLAGIRSDPGRTHRKKK